MDATLSANELRELQRISTPSIANAIERFNIRPRTQGFMSPEVRCMLPDLGVMVGYVEDEESQIISYCRSPDFTLEGLKQTWTRVRGKS